MGHPGVGDRVEDHELTVAHPDRTLERSGLRWLAADRAVLLALWPDDAWSGSTADPGRDLAWIAGHAHVQLLGVGRRAIETSAGLGFPMAADPDGAVACGLRRRRERAASFLVDASLVVRDRWLGEPVAAEIHADLQRRFRSPDAVGVYGTRPSA